MTVTTTTVEQIAAPPACEACGEPVGYVEWAMAAEDNYPIHIACVKRRHRAALSGRCGCRTQKWAKECSNGPGRYARRWLACTRCGGQIKQLS